jgi:chromosome segregation ATPase
MNNLALIDKYLENHIDSKNFKKRLTVNTLNIPNILQGSNIYEDLFVFADILIILATLSPRKDFFLAKIEELQDDEINFYLEIVEKYIISDDYSSNNMRSRSGTRISKLSIRKTQNQQRERTFSLYSSLDKSILKTEDKQYKRLADELKEAYDIIQELRNKNEVLLEKNNEVFNLKNENLKLNSDLNEAKQLLSTYDLQIEELTKQNAFNIKKYIDQIADLTKQIDTMKTLETDLRQSAFEGEKIKSKLKEFIILKSKAEDFDNLKIQFENLNNEVEVVRKDKLSLNHKIDNLKKDLIQANEKIKYLESDRINIQIELDDYKKEAYKSAKKSKISMFVNKRFSIYSELNNSIKEENTNKEEGDYILGDIDISSVQNKIDNNPSIKEDEVFNQNNDYDHAFSQIERLSKELLSLKNEIFELKLENNQLKTKIKKTPDEYYSNEFTLKNILKENNSLENSRRVSKQDPVDIKLIAKHVNFEIERESIEINNKTEHNGTILKSQNDAKNQILINNKEELNILRMDNNYKERRIVELQALVQKNTYKHNLIMEKLNQLEEDRLEDSKRYNKELNKKQLELQNIIDNHKQENEILLDSYYKLALKYNYLKTKT